VRPGVAGRARIRAWHHWLRVGPWRGGVALCAASTPTEHLDYLDAHGIERLVAGEERVDLAAALDWLAERHGVRTVRVDSGGTLNGALLRAGLVDEVSVLVHPALVGGTSPRSLFRASDLEHAGGVVALSLEAMERVRRDVVWLRYTVRRP
jgi:2,5-diamino-6-(ribosylamino)-4(3H)-pyrimidinone 5'-phosphate reductase